VQVTSNISTSNSPFFNYSEKVQKNACSRYELSNHLGNVLAVITDRRIQTCGMGDVMHYEAQVVSISDYYPFGMGIKDREWKDSTFSYRFGFNGKEKDDDVSGEGNNLDFGARIYDSRLGRWFKPDPMEAHYSNLSTYSFAQNNPIIFIDKAGRKIDISKMTPEELTKYQAILAVLMESDIFVTMYEALENSDRVIQIKMVESMNGEYSSDNTKNAEMYQVKIPMVGKNVEEKAAQELFHSFQNIPENSLIRKKYSFLDYEAEGEVFSFIVSTQIRERSDDKLYGALANPLVEFANGAPVFTNAVIFEDLRCGIPSVEEMASSEFSSLFNEYKIMFEKEAVQRQNEALYLGKTHGPYDHVIGNKSDLNVSVIMHLVSNTRLSSNNEIDNGGELKLNTKSTNNIWEK
jgi:RHS repeat-associated protein